MDNKLKTVDAETLLSTPMSKTMFIVDGLISQGVNVISGASKIGKSWLMLWLGLHVAQGNSIWGLPTLQCDVLYRCVSLRDNSCKYRRSYGSCRNRGCICKSLYTAVRTLCNQYFVFQLDVHSMWHCGFCSLRSYSHEGAKEHRK